MDVLPPPLRILSQSLASTNTLHGAVGLLIPVIHSGEPTDARRVRCEVDGLDLAQEDGG
jgi:hypothetical protein